MLTFTYAYNWELVYNWATEGNPKLTFPLPEQLGLSQIFRCNHIQNECDSVTSENPDVEQEMEHESLISLRKRMCKV